MRPGARVVKVGTHADRCPHSCPRSPSARQLAFASRRWPSPVQDGSADRPGRRPVTAASMIREAPRASQRALMTFPSCRTGRSRHAAVSPAPALSRCRTGSSFPDLAGGCPSSALDRGCLGRTWVTQSYGRVIVPRTCWFLRSSQTAPATAPRMITAPMAMNQVMMPKIAPIVP